MPAASEATMILDEQEVLTAVADPLRRSLLKLLGEGAAYDVTTLAANVRRPRDTVAKHLKVLRDARLIRPVTPPGTDGRKTFHVVPSLYITKDAAGRRALDFGSVVVRL